MADEHHSVALSTPPRDKRDAALDIARGTLLGVYAGLPDDYQRTRRLIKKALADIDPLLGKGEGR